MAGFPKQRKPVADGFAGFDVVDRNKRTDPEARAVFADSGGGSFLMLIRQPGSSFIHVYQNVGAACDHLRLFAVFRKERHSFGHCFRLKIIHKLCLFMYRRDQS